MSSSKWMFKDVSKIDVSKLSNEDLLSLQEFINKRSFKHGSHLIRLLNMAIEFLDNGEFIVDRPDKKLLLDIKLGNYKLEEIKKMTDDLFAVAEVKYQNSKLPEKPNFNKCNQLLIDITHDYLINNMPVQSIAN